MSSWTENIEKYIQKLHNKTYIYSWVHTHSYMYYDRLDFWCNMIVTIITFALGTALLATVQQNAICANDYIAQGIFGAVSLICTIVLTVRQSKNYSDKIDKHKSASQDWLLLGNKIEKQLVLPIDKRDDAEVFIDNVNDSCEDLIRGKIEIPSSVMSKFEKTFKISFERMELEQNTEFANVSAFLEQFKTKKHHAIDIKELQQPQVGAITIDVKTQPEPESKKDSLQSVNRLRLQEEFEKRLKDLKHSSPQ